MKKRVNPRSGRKAEDGSVTTVLAEIRSLALEVKGDAIPLKLLDDLSWMVDRGLENRVLKLLDEDLSEDSSSAIAFGVKLAASRLTFPGIPGSLAKKGAIEELETLVLIPFAILVNASFLVGELSQFPIELPEAVGRASELGLFQQAFGLSDDVTVYIDPRLYQPQSDEWLVPSATRSYIKSIAAHLQGPETPVTPLSLDYRRPLRPRWDGALDDEIDICHRLICGAIVTRLGKSLRSLEEAGDLVFGERDDEAGMEEIFEEFSRLIEQELRSRSGMTEATVMANAAPVELWDVPRFAFQTQRLASLGFAIQMALEEFEDREPGGRAMRSVLYVSTHGSENVLQEVRFAAYLVDDDDVEEERAIFTYVWQIAFELEELEDLDGAMAEVADRLNATVNAVEDLRPAEQCEDCGAALFGGPGGKMYHEVNDLNECPPPFQN